MEGRNFDIRKNLLEYDDVSNDQRRVIYNQRDEILASDDLSESVRAIRRDVMTEVVHTYLPPGSIDEQWDVAGLEQALQNEYHVQAPVSSWLEEDTSLHIDGVVERVIATMEEAYAAKEDQVETMGISLRKVEKHLVLQVLDRHWKDHLASMDHLRQGIHLRGYAQKNPKQEYKREAFELFQEMMTQIQHELIRVLSALELRRDDAVERLEQQRAEEARRMAEQMRTQTPEMGTRGVAREQTGAEAGSDAAQPFVRDGRKVGRNEPCWCGSGKKYKHCHGQLES